MRILYILPFVPWPIKVRSYNLIPRLARRNEIHLLALARSGEEEERLHNVARHCASATVIAHSRSRGVLNCMRALPTPVPFRIAYFRSREMREAAQRLTRMLSPDVIYLERWRTLQYVAGIRTAPVLCDPTDCMALYNHRLTRGKGVRQSLLGREEHRRFRSYEPAMGRECRKVVFCSEVDREYFEALGAGSDCVIVPNGVDCSRFRAKDPAKEEPATLIFSGAFSYLPNRRGVEFFLERIFPLIRKRVPQARFVAAGYEGAKFFSRHASETAGIQVLDWVDDLHPYLERATVSVVPLKIGAGVSNKILEAFASQLAVVSTRLPCGDLPVKDGEHLFIADEPEDFAAKVVRLIEDRNLRNRMAAQGRRLVEERYDWEVVAAQMEHALAGVINKRRPTENEFSGSMGIQGREVPRAFHAEYGAQS